MHHHECMLVVVGNAGLMREALCDAIAFVDPRIAAATALIGSHRSRSRPDEQWMRGNPSDCMQERWETDAILSLCVRPAVHSIIKVNDSKVHALHLHELRNLKRKARVSYRSRSGHEIHIGDAFEIFLHLRKVRARNRVADQEHIRKSRRRLVRANLPGPLNGFGKATALGTSAECSDAIAMNRASPILRRDLKCKDPSL